MNSYVKDVQSEFRFRPASFARNQGAISRTESIFKALAENGPVSVSSDQYRVWISPFTHHSNSTGEMAGREWLMGSLVGVEYRDLKNKYTIGLLGGGNFGHAREKGRSENGANFTGIDMGAYASYGAWEGGRIDATYVRSINDITQSRMTDINRIAKNNHKMTIDMIDAQTSHVFKLPGDQWSVRLNAGHFYTHEDSDGYTETGALHRNRRISATKGRTYEVYGGLGLRWNCRGEVWRTRVTAVYEYGKEYKKTRSTVRRSHGSSFNIHTFQRPDVTKARTHYASLYTTVNDKSGWKFFLGYNGAFTKNSVDTGFSVKVEKRF
ncbi:MAG: autotransporter outer membrane beta-barrel domain-containing protein [Alphaproteobacteria bacterium]|nr:autotransporter outer membrane beta-barrel domain-containing protein [Alphaproteobacteria bacterium]